MIDIKRTAEDDAEAACARMRVEALIHILWADSIALALYLVDRFGCDAAKRITERAGVLEEESGGAKRPVDAMVRAAIEEMGGGE